MLCKLCFAMKEKGEIWFWKSTTSLCHPRVYLLETVYLYKRVKTHSSRHLHHYHSLRILLKSSRWSSLLRLAFFFCMLLILAGDICGWRKLDWRSWRIWSRGKNVKENKEAILGGRKLEKTEWLKGYCCFGFFVVVFQIILCSLLYDSFRHLLRKT